MDENAVAKEYLTTVKDEQNYKTKFYNLDLIISVEGAGTISHKKVLEKAYKEYDKYIKNHLTKEEKDYLEIIGEDIKNWNNTVANYYSEDKKAKDN